MTTKRRIALVFLMVTVLVAGLVTTAWADERTGRYKGIGPSATVNGFLEGNSSSFSAGAMKFQMNGGDLVGTFCTDLRHYVTEDIEYAATEEELRCEIVWLMQHYPPDLSGNGNEMAARQAAVWHFSDGFDPVQPGESGYDAAIEGRAWELIDVAEAASCAGVLRGQPNLVISPVNASQPQSQLTINYTVEATVGGEPVAGLEINLATTFGALSADTVTTGVDGSAAFSLTNDGGGAASAAIDASATYTLALGTAFKVIDDVDNHQWLVLGEETLGQFFAGASATWLPDGSVTAHVFHDLDMDGVQGDNNEIDLSDWTVTLYQDDGAGGWTEISAGTTVTDGTISWEALAADQYKAALTLKNGWRATNPYQVEFELLSGGSQYVDLGVIRTPVVNTCVFNDLNGDGYQDPGEPWLDGWTVAIVSGPGALQGQSGRTTDGCVVFSWPRNKSFVAGEYVVAETLQDGWSNSTPVNQSVTLASGDMVTLTFGNYHADLVFDKTGPVYVREGQTFTYDFTVTNSGASTLTGVVEDPLLPDLVCSFEDLAPGATVTCQADYNVPAGGADPVLNTATATATFPISPTASITMVRYASHSVDVIHPAITVDASVSPTLVYSGTAATWTVEVTNAGDDALTDVTVSDSNGHAYGDPFDLTPGASQTFTYITNPGQATTNVVDASATDSLGGSVSDSDSATVDTIWPGIQVTESVSPDTIHGGDAVLWTVEVTNLGDDALTDVTLSDDNGHAYGDPFDLVPGASQSFTYTTNPEQDVTNVVSASATDALGGTVSDSDNAAVHVIQPGLDVVETVTPETLYSGDMALWRVLVTNAGEELLTDVTLSDDVNGHDYGDPFDLAPGASRSFTYTTAPEADVTNTVTASGLDPLGGSVSASDDAAVNVIQPAIQVVETAEPAMAYAGDEVVWQVVVTNVGDDPLTQINMSDLNGHAYGPSFDLAAGESVTFTYSTYPVVNVSDETTATGRDSLGGTVSDSDSASVEVIHPAIQVVETVDPPLTYVGSEVVWHVVVTNVGDDPLTGVTLSDDAGHDYGAPFSLAVGASRTFSYTTIVAMTTANDVTAVGVDALGGNVIDEASAIVNVINPDIQVEETVLPDVIHSGDEVVWRIVVTNNSDDFLTAIQVQDDNGHDYGAPFDLGVGESQVFTYTTAPSSDTVNLVSASGMDALGNTVSDSATADVQVLNPAIEIVKTASVATVPASDPVQWTLTVYNRGDATLYDVTVADSNGKQFGPTTLTAADGDDAGGNDQVIWTYTTYPIEDVTNQATASGVDALGMTVTDEDMASVQVTAGGDEDPPEEGGDADGDGTPGYGDTDADNDGIPDDVEGNGDADGDGTPNYLDSDSDGDGIPDEIEGAGDADGDGTPNFLDSDSDGDGIPDEVEGADDADGDGTPNFLDSDSDGDGIPDEIEGADDADGDGTPNFLDLDSDGDGIPDAVEGADDADGDGTPNFLDLDSDGDGIPDAVEGADDADGDGTPNFLDLDSDGDGIPDAVEGADDADGDGTPNFLDLDSDGDGIPDAVEGAEDSDGDGMPDYLDTDSDGDGISDAGEWSEGADDPLAGCSVDDPVCFDNDADDDGTPNYLDTDSDGDGIPDAEEGLKDSDEDGIPDWLDPNLQSQDAPYQLFFPIIIYYPEPTP